MNPQQKEFDTALANLTPEERATYVSKNPVVNVGGVQQALSPTAPVVMTGDELASTEAPMAITNPRLSTAVEGLGESIGAGAETNLKEYTLSDTRKAEQEKLQRQGAGIGKYITESKGQTQLTEEQAAPVDAAEAELRDINNQIIQEQVANRRRIESIDKTFTGTAQGKIDEVNRINRESIAKQADLSVIQMAKQGKYDSAKAIADRKVAALMEQQKNEYEAKVFNYNENKDLFTKSEQRGYEQYLSNEDERIKKEETDAKTISDLSINALENGAPVSVAAQMRSAKTVEEAILAGGQYVNKLSRDKTIRDNNISSLPPAVQTRVQTIAGQFDNEQAVKAYQTAAEAIDAFKNSGTSPTDDISRIYAFAKVMDPNSVVREGEYKTVQDYSTALLERTGIKAKRIFDNSGFLTEEARKFMGDTLDNRLSSSRKAYDNIYSEYGRRINKITGASDGTDYVTDYSRAFNEPVNTSQPADIKVKAIYTSRPELKPTINQMVQDGLGWDVILQALEDK